MTTHTEPTTASPRLVVADWEADPHAVVAAWLGDPRAPLRIVVPAWLHGLDWAGDPWASVPCAERQLARLRSLAAAAGLDVVAGEVGDPDPVTAIGDALADAPAAEVVVFTAGHRPLGLAGRVRRATGLPARALTVPSRPRRRRARGLGAGHCRPSAA